MDMIDVDYDLQGGNNVWYENSFKWLFDHLKQIG